MAGKGETRARAAGTRGLGVPPGSRREASHTRLGARGSWNSGVQKKADGLVDAEDTCERIRRQRNWSAVGTHSKRNHSKHTQLQK